jgi:hypothetical protein
MSNWNYGDAFKRYPIKENETAIFDNGSMLKVHDIFNELPKIMLDADLIFCDPPWNLGNLNTFYTKADKEDEHKKSFEKFYLRLFECIKKIQANICYIEVGKEYLAEFIQETKKIYKYVTFYNSTYYHKKDRLCYVIRGSNKSKKPHLDGLDEETMIEYICKNEDYKCICDLCMGMGLVAINAYKNNKRFVGTEMNKKRLSVTIEKLVKEGASFSIVKNKIEKEDVL